MRQIVPGVAVGTVVLSDCAPLPFAEIGPPQIPVTGLPQSQVESAEAVDPLSLRTGAGGHLSSAALTG
jgi:hypothetical protein